jgi:hypothetical protein
MSAGVRPRMRRVERRWAAASRRGSGPRRSGAETPSAGDASAAGLGKIGSGLDWIWEKSVRLGGCAPNVFDLNGPPASPPAGESPGIYDPWTSLLFWCPRDVDNAVHICSGHLFINFFIIN